MEGKPLDKWAWICIILLMAVILLGCQLIGGEKPSSEESAKAIEPTVTHTKIIEPSKTPKPTSTPKPSATPDIVATQQYSEFLSLIQHFEDKGYVDSTNGTAYQLAPFEEEWAQIGWFRWWPYEFSGADFVFSGHFDWSTASATPEISGCGIVFGLQENDDYYAVFLDKSRILFLRKTGASLYEVGKTRGSGRANFGNPAEADFAIAVKDKSAFVSVNGEVTEYTLLSTQSTEGTFAATLLSGTNSDYGTRCEITDMMLWYPGDGPFGVSSPSMEVPSEEAPSETGDLIFRDDFDDSLASEWDWTRADEGQWNLTDSPGYLHVNLTHTSDPYSGGVDTLLLRSIEEDDFEIITRVGFEPQRNFQRVGLVIAEDDQNFLALLRAYADVGNNLGNGIYFDHVARTAPNYDDPDFRNFATSISDPSNVYLKLRKEGQTYTSYYSLDGQSWVMIGEHLSQIAPVSYGLLIGRSDRPISADFDYFEINRLP